MGILDDWTPEEVREAVATKLKEGEEELDMAADVIQRDPDLLIALHEIVRDTERVSPSTPIVSKDQLKVARAVCYVFRIFMRVRMLRYAQEKWPDGRIPFEKVRPEELGLL